MRAIFPRTTQLRGHAVAHAASLRLLAPQQAVLTT